MVAREWEQIVTVMSLLSQMGADNVDRGVSCIDGRIVAESAHPRRKSINLGETTEEALVLL